MRRRPTAIAAALSVALAALGVGCASDDDAAPVPAASTTTTPVTTGGAGVPTTAGSPGGGSIADVDFDHFTFRFPSAAGSGAELDEVTVTDGVYSGGAPPETFYFEVADVDLADLDGDGAAEAAVTVVYNTGGSGQFTDVLVYRWAGGEASYVTADGVGDRGDGGVDDVGVAPAGGVVGDVLVVRRNADAEGACCPTALEERTLRLRDDTLVEVGDPEKWGIVRIGVDDDGNPTDEPTVVEFLRGTARADLTGDATEPVAATFEAEAGQTLRLALDTEALGENPLVVVISGPDGELGRLGTGLDASIELDLPSTGDHLIRFEPVEPVDEELGVYFDADLRIL